MIQRPALYAHESIRLLHTKDHAAVGTDDLASDPRTLGTSKHGNDSSNLLSLTSTATRRLSLLDDGRVVDTRTHSHERGVLDEGLDELLELFRVARVHLGADGAGVDGVDGAVLAELASPGFCHGLESRLGTAVDALSDETQAGAHTAEVDDAAGAVVGEVGLSSLDEQQGTHDVDIEAGGEVLGLDVGDLVVEGDTSIVDEDVDAERAEGLRGLRDEAGGAGGGAEVGLDGHGLDGVLGGQLGGQAGCGSGRVGRSVSEDEVCAAGGESLGDGQTDAWEWSVVSWAWRDVN